MDLKELKKKEADHVYRCLVEIYPQVDERYLKAVAWEHSKDSNKAVEVVLEDEFLPCISSRSAAAGPPPLVNSSPSSLPDGEAEHEEPVSMLRRRRVASEETETAFSSSELRLKIKEDAIRTDVTSAVQCCADSAGQEDVLSCDASVATNQLEGNSEKEPEKNTDDEVISNAVIHDNSAEVNELIPDAVINSSDNGSSRTSFDECQDASDKVSHEQEISEGTPFSLIQENDGLNLSFTSYHSDWKDFDGPELDDSDYIVMSGKNREVEKKTPETFGGVLPSEFPSSYARSMLSSILDEIEGAKEEKKILCQDMESLNKREKEVELKEIAAKQAIEDNLAKAQEFKQMVAHAIEANEMQVGEAYGESAILATEARELQAQLLSLSAARDKIRAEVDEKRQAIEERFAAAEELEKAAEESAQNVLVEQEKIGILATKAKKLQQWVDDNSKLKESFMDCGRVIDTLQGEILVLAQDWRALKEKFFDERVPLSESSSSSQSTCILASSGSSLKGILSNVTSELDETPESPKRSCSPTCSVDGQSLKSRHSDERIMANDGKELLLEDGWDLLDE